MSNQYKQLITILGLFIFIPFTAFAGGNDEVVANTTFDAIIGKTLKVTHVDWQGVNLPATTHFEIEFIDKANCVILINGQKHEGTWAYNSRKDCIDVKNSVFGSIKQFSYEKSGPQINILQRVNEEQMHRMIKAALR
ncbi:MAG: hypothetical protein ACPGJS_17105 [Flammeovirgaceae bacterium]